MNDLNGKHIVILGAGTAGLSAAYALSLAGARTTVLEKEAYVGGLCCTIRHGDYYFDLGGHRFITEDDEVLKLVQNLLKDQLQERPRSSEILLQKKFFLYPLESADLLKKMNPWLTISCLFSYLRSTLSRVVNPKEDVSLQDWIRHRFGDQLYKIYFGPYSAKLWGLPPDQISSEWAAQRITLLNLWDVIQRLFSTRKKVPKTYVSKFWYPKYGIGQICDALADDIKNHGGSIILSSEVKKINLSSNNSIESVSIESSDQEGIIKGDYFISTIPLPELVEYFDPSLSSEIREAASKLSFRSLRFLNLCLDCSQLTKNCWIYVPEKDYIFFRIQEPYNWSPYTVPTGKTSLILEIACNFKDQIWNAENSELVQIAIKDLEKIGISVKNKLMDSFSTYVKHAYPIYNIGYGKQLKYIMNGLENINNLLLCGRQGLYRYNNMDHSLKMGLLIASHLLHGTPIQEAYNIAADPVQFAT